jgi:L-ascorbate metabolism protein UlaG (beta-lactamase superfamily)
MRAKRRPVTLISFLLIFIAAGCWPLRVGLEHISDAFTSEPIRIPNKIKDPVKDNVSFSVLWAGHSTTLIQIDDKVILFDPVFEDIIGGVLMRRIECGLEIKSIPKLDVIMISHAHMDHLSLESLDKLGKKFPGAKLVFPEGAEEYLPDLNMEMVMMRTGNNAERDFTGETKMINGVKVTTVYALHFGGRYGLDSYLWNYPGCTGYIAEYNGKSVYYGGDTGYEEHAFKRIGEKFKIDLALIPIGPCRDCDSIGTGSALGHIGTRTATIMFSELKAKYMVPVHFGSFQFFADPYLPLTTLIEIMREQPDLKEKVILLKEGEQKVIEYKKE